MKIHHDIKHAIALHRPVITTGTFDGVHIGHRKLIERLKALAMEQKGETVVVTFDPHPRLVLFPEDNELRLLSTLAEKEALLEEAGVDHLVIIPFTREFSRLTSHEWIRDVLVNKLGVHTLVIGYDHHFGRNREGGIEQLKTYSNELGFVVEEIPAQDIDDIKVSSTKIRQAISTGDVKTAASYLTYPYMFTGTVVEGDQRGRQIGYPTANLYIKDKLKLVPADGVYAVNVLVNNKMHKGMLNIGLRPTVDGKKHAIEVHIFNLDENLYGKELTLQMISRIRSEMKFENVDALRLQLGKDAEVANSELSTV